MAGPLMSLTDIPSPRSTLQTMLLEQLGASGTIRSADLKRAVAAAETADKRLDQALVDLGLMAEIALDGLLASALAVADFDPGLTPKNPVQAAGSP